MSRPVSEHGWSPSSTVPQFASLVFPFIQKANPKTKFPPCFVFLKEEEQFPFYDFDFWTLYSTWMILSRRLGVDKISQMDRKQSQRKNKPIHHASNRIQWISKRHRRVLLISGISKNAMTELNPIKRHHVFYHPHDESSECKLLFQSKT